MARSVSTSQYYTEPDHNDWSPTVQDISILIWIKGGNSSGYVAGKGGSPWEWAIQKSGTDNINVRSWISSGSSNHSAATVTGTLSDGNWHGFIGILDNPSIAHTAVMDDAFVTDVTFVGSMSNTSATMYVGRRGDTSAPFAGTFAHFVIFHSVLDITTHAYALSRGVNPLALGINPKIWIPFWGYNSTEEDWSRTNRDMSPTGTPTAQRAGPPVELVEKYIS